MGLTSDKVAREIAIETGLLLDHDHFVAIDASQNVFSHATATLGERC